MKLIVAGATGFIGSHVVKQCISNPAVTSILVVARREPATELSASPKVKVILHQDFSDWPSSLLDQLEGAEGCIWYTRFTLEDVKLATDTAPKDCWRQSSRFPKR
jgi:uncharacterized protein YbjT (DUF2867 family)